MLLLICTYVLLQAKFKAPIVTEIAEVCLLCSTCCAARSHMLFDGRNVLHTDLCHSDHVHSFPPSLPPLQISKYTPAEDYHQQYLAKNPNGYCGIGGTGVVCPIGVGVEA